MYNGTLTNVITFMFASNSTSFSKIATKGATADSFTLSSIPSAVVAINSGILIIKQVFLKAKF